METPVTEPSARPRWHQALGRLLRWKHKTLAASVDQAAVVARVEENSRWSGGYLFFIVTSAAIALFGLLQNSPAVIIGAMLVAPLMGPIMGMGFSLATFDFAAMKRAAKAAALGSIIAIGLTTLLVLLSPIQTLTSELAGRTQPNLLDLGVAFFSGLAGAYATVRDKGATIVGVAIATALMPPLATVGYGIATANGAVAGGAFLLFLTNFMTIAFTTTIVARVFGFGHYLSARQTRMQALAIVAMFGLLSVPLALTLAKVARETTTTASISAAVLDAYSNGAQIDELAVDYDAKPVRIDALAVTGKVLSDKDIAALETRLAMIVGQPVTLQLAQVRAENETLVSERDRIRSMADSIVRDGEQARKVEAALMNTTGIARSDIMIDSQRRLATVAVRSRADTPWTWEELHTLERDVRDASPEWTIRVTPPALAPEPVFAGSEEALRLDADATARMAWASARLGRTLLIPRTAARANDAVAAIQAAGGTAQLGPNDRLTWSEP